jgi:hypothetical protein
MITTSLEILGILVLFALGSIVAIGILRHLFIEPRFTVEYYPLTKVYFCKCGDEYLKRGYRTGIIELLDDYCFAYATQFYTEQEALKFIELYKEQQLKQNVKTIQVK